MIKENKAFIVATLFILIIAATATVFFLNRNNTLQTSNQTLTSNLVGYDALKQKLTALSSDSTITNQAFYRKTINRLSLLENKTASDAAKYQSIVIAAADMNNLYASTNNHKLYSFPDDFIKVAKTNFPKLYRSTDFLPIVCIDLECAQNPQPPEILRIVEEIKNSNIPLVVKDSFVRDLLNAGYINNNQLDNKIFTYIVVAHIFQTSGALKQAGLNQVLSAELNDYIRKSYPEQYRKLAIPSSTSTPK